MVYFPNTDCPSRFARSVSRKPYYYGGGAPIISFGLGGGAADGATIDTIAIGNKKKPAAMRASFCGESG